MPCSLPTHMVYTTRTRDGRTSYSEWSSVSYGRSFNSKLATYSIDSVGFLMIFISQFLQWPRSPKI